MSTARTRLRMEAAPLDARVTSSELFFDLVFVFALTQVTQLMADDLTGRGILRGESDPRSAVVELDRLRLAVQRRPGGRRAGRGLLC